MLPKQRSLQFVIMIYAPFPKIFPPPKDCKSKLTFRFHRSDHKRLFSSIQLLAKRLSRPMYEIANSFGAESIGSMADYFECFSSGDSAAAASSHSCFAVFYNRLCSFFQKHLSDIFYLGFISMVRKSQITLISFILFLLTIFMS